LKPSTLKGKRLGHQGHREEYLKSLQEWDAILVDPSLNQWNIEDLIAHDIIEGVHSKLPIPNPHTLHPVPCTL
jgi:hypothetical protein